MIGCVEGGAGGARPPEVGFISMFGRFRGLTLASVGILYASCRHVVDIYRHIVRNCKHVVGICMYVLGICRHVVGML